MIGKQSLKLKKIKEIKLSDEPEDHLHVYQLFTIQLIMIFLISRSYQVVF